MIVYKNFLRMVWSHKISSIIFIFIFLGVSFFTLFNNKEDEYGIGEFTSKHLRLIIADYDKSEVSKKLVEYLKTIHNVNILNTVIDEYSENSISKNTVYKNKEAQNTEQELEIEKSFRCIKKNISLDKADAGFIFCKGLEKALSGNTTLKKNTAKPKLNNEKNKMELNKNNIKPNKDKAFIIALRDDKNINAFYVESQIEQFLIFAETQKKVNGKFNFEKILQVLAIEVPVKKTALQTEGKTATHIKKFFDFFGWAIFSIILNSIGWTVFALDKKYLKIRTLISPVSNIRLAAENFLAQLTVVFIYLFIFIGFAAVVNIHNLNKIPLMLYTLNAAIYTSVILSASFMMTTILKKNSLIGIVGTVLPLSLAFISGIFIEQKYIPSSITAIAKLFPTYYYISANEYIKTSSQIDLQNILFMILFFMLYFSLGIYFTKLTRIQDKIELEQK